jgi:hypothetical protein
MTLQTCLTGRFRPTPTWCDRAHATRDSIAVVMPCGRADRNICRIPSSRHQHAADAGNVMSGIEGPPATANEGFEPRAEIHGGRIGGHTDISQVPLYNSVPEC